jgi:hypothetical protein
MTITEITPLVARAHLAQSERKRAGEGFNAASGLDAGRQMAGDRK